MTHTIYVEPADEEGYVPLGCLECGCDGDARYGMAVPVRYLDVSLECENCGTELVRWTL